MTATEALGWALLHFLWQGALFALALRITLALIPRSKSATRYLLAMGTLVAMAIVFGITAIRAYDPAGTPPSITIDRRFSPSTDAVTSTIWTPSLDGPVATTAPDSIGTVRSPTPRERLDRALPSIVLGWAIGVALLSLRLLRGWRSAQRAATAELGPAPAAWLDALERLALTMGVKQSVRLRLSAGVEVPAVIGWLRPLIVAPAAAMSGLSMAQVELLLAHELAHVRRHDYLLNVVQCLIEALLFYHPATWWISSTIRDEREHCCDDIVVSLEGDPISYAEALLAMEQLRSIPAIPAVAATGGKLAQRIRRLLTPPVDAAPMSRLGAGVIMATGVVVLVAGLHWSSVSSTKEKQSSAITEPLDSTVDSLSNRQPGISRRQASTTPGLGIIPVKKGSLSQASGIINSVAIDTLEDLPQAQKDSALVMLRNAIEMVISTDLDGDNAGPMQTAKKLRPVIDNVRRIVARIDELQGEWTLDGQYVPEPRLAAAKQALNSSLRPLIIGMPLDAVPEMRKAYQSLRSYFVRSSDEARNRLTNPAGNRQPTTLELRLLEIVEQAQALADSQKTMPKEQLTHASERVATRLQSIIQTLSDMQARWTIDGRYPKNERLAASYDAITVFWNNLENGNPAAAVEHGWRGYQELQSYLMAQAPMANIRGLTKGDVVTLLNGGRVEKEAIERIPENEIDRVEILKGPATVKIYGGPIGEDGAINVVTKPGFAARKSRGDHRLVAGTDLLTSWTGEMVLIVDGKLATPADIQAIDVATVERIEILRGSQASTFYGDSTSAGVIAVTTRRPEDRPLSGRRLRIEADTALTGDGSLVVIDGRVVHPDILNMLDNSEIERVEILKGPDIGKQYGQPGAKGVISITTKRGVFGRPQSDKNVPAAVAVITSDELERPATTANDLEHFRSWAYLGAIFPRPTQERLGTGQSTDEESAENVERLRKTALFADGRLADRIEAIRMLGELGRRAAKGTWSGATGPEFGRPSTRIVQILSELVERRSEEAVTQRAAIDALARIGNSAALAAIAGAIQGHPNALIRAKAVSAYAAAASSIDWIPFFTRQLKSESSRLVQSEMLGTLRGDLDEGVPALIEIAKHHSDREVRRLAIGFWAELDQEAAARALEELERERR